MLSASEIMDWLLTPLSGSNVHSVSDSFAWHGRLMVLGMGVLMPPMVIVARYFKIMPKQDWPRQLDNPFWFVTHRRWGHIIGICVLLGLVFAASGKHWALRFTNFHSASGWAVVLLVLVQIVGAWLRGTHGGPVDPFTHKRRPPEKWAGDHFDMTKRRIIFEYVHKVAGYIAIAFSVAAIVSGLVAADAPRWMPLVMIAWWLAIFGEALRLQRTGRCVDTYQAIWGVDPRLPGNQRRPIGFGILHRSERDRTSKTSTQT
jgi:heme A synthase